MISRYNKPCKMTTQLWSSGSQVPREDKRKNNFWGRKVQLFERILKMNSLMHKPANLQLILEKIGFQNIIYDPTNNGLTYAMIGTK